MNAEIRNLLAKAMVLPHGSARFDLIREAVRLADLSNDLQARFRVRLQLVEVATFSHRPTDLIVHFTWLLNHHEAYREAYGNDCDRTLLWDYKWVLSIVQNVAAFSKEQIDYFLRDSRRRYEAYAGPEARTLDLLEVNYRIQCGDYSGARQLLEKAEQMPRNSLSDCYACEESRRIRLWTSLGEPSRAFQAYEDLTKAGWTCMQEPMIANSRAALFYASAGRREEAEAAYRAGLPKAGKNDALMEHCFRFLMGASFLSERDADAVSLFDRSFEIYSTTIQKQDYFEYCLIGHRMMEALLERGVGELSLRCAGLLPFTAKPADGRVSVQELSAWLLDQAKETGAIFNQRNGASHFSRLIEERWPFAPPAGE